MSEDGRSFTHISYHIAGTWRVHTATYPDTTPIFGIDAGPSFPDQPVPVEGPRFE